MLVINYIYIYIYMYDKFLLSAHQKEPKQKALGNWPPLGPFMAPLSIGAAGFILRLRMRACAHARARACARAQTRARAHSRASAHARVRTHARARTHACARGEMHACARVRTRACALARACGMHYHGNNVI